MPNHLLLSFLIVHYRSFGCLLIPLRNLIPIPILPSPVQFIASNCSLNFLHFQISQLAHIITLVGILAVGTVWRLSCYITSGYYGIFLCITEDAHITDWGGAGRTVIEQYAKGTSLWCYCNKTSNAEQTSRRHVRRNRSFSHSVAQDGGRNEDGHCAPRLVV